jgi:hypothetical protein
MRGRDRILKLSRLITITHARPKPIRTGFLSVGGPRKGARQTMLPSASSK